jgi:hypothetical protein
LHGVPLEVAKATYIPGSSLADWRKRALMFSKEKHPDDCEIEGRTIPQREALAQAIAIMTAAQSAVAKARDGKRFPRDELIWVLSSTGRSWHR